MIRYAMHHNGHQLMYIPCIFIHMVMRTTLNIDDTLLAEAGRLTGLSERTALVHEGLRALIERESARRLARLAGSEPRLQKIPRRRSPGW